MPGSYLCGFFLLLQGCLGLCCNGQDRKEDFLMTRLHHDIQMERERYGRLEWDDDTKETFYTLMLTSSADALVRYTDDSIPMVRARIFTGLCQRKVRKQVLNDVLSRHRNDTAEFVMYGADVGIHWNVRQYMEMTMDLRAKNRLTKPDYAAKLERLSNDRLNSIVMPGTYHKTISKDSLLTIDSLVFRRKDLRVLSFSMTIGDETLVSTNFITPEMKRLMEGAMPGQSVYFDEITAEGSDKVKRRLTGMGFKIR